ncbi:MAG TPA: DNA primase [Thermoleophilia bacterium]|nr:DNA primase [Thermoleophilia bacterium]
MPLIKDSSVEAVLGAADIVDVVSGYTSLRKRGSTYTGLCPFHSEKTPSFSVSADKGLYYCFGCGEGGDVVSFIRQFENLSFAEAVEHLSERFAVPLEYEEGGRDEGERDRARRLQELIEKAAAFYERWLWDSQEGERARAYLEGRGLGQEVCREYRLGLAPGQWRGLQKRALRQGFSEEEMEAAGLLIRRDGGGYDRFRERLLFPLIDHRGRVLGFGGRVLGDEKPKYLNSPEGPLYRKGRLVYGLFQARRAIAEADEVIVAEGYTDVLALAQAGVRNVVASMGTAFTSHQLRLVARFTEHVSFMFDADAAGTEAIARSGEVARAEGLRAMVIPLPAGSDPADAVKDRSPEEAKALVASKISLLAFEVRRALDEGNLESVEGRVRTFERVRALLRRAASPKETEEEIANIADRLRLSQENVSLLLKESGRRGNSGGGPHRTGGAAGERRVDTLERVLSRDTELEKEFLCAAVAHPKVAVSLLAGLTPEHFTDPVNRQVYLALADALAAPDPAEKVRELARADDEAGRLFVRLAFEADGSRYSEAVLREHNLRLQDRNLERIISLMRTRLSSEGLSAHEERRLVNLERYRSRLRALFNAEES